jgi:hypothetical protein
MKTFRNRTMDHSEAVEQMATERYLLDELSPELREEFEEHAFDCPECALDLRAGAGFLREAKAQLPELTALSPAPSLPAVEKARAKKTDWFSWLQPAFAVPVFAVLLAVIGFQNLATIPGLRVAATQPRLVPWVSVHAGTRGGGHTSVLADRKQGAVILMDLPQDSGYTSYSFDLFDPQNKPFWSQNASIPSENDGAERTFSLLIPGAGLQQGSYTVTVSGINAQGQRTEIDHHVFDVRFDQ